MVLQICNLLVSIRLGLTRSRSLDLIEIIASEHTPIYQDFDDRSALFYCRAPARYLIFVVAEICRRFFPLSLTF
eukprot:COSAG05_NODE_15_length_36348_cov_78.369307_9_plen_74_part_00